MQGGYWPGFGFFCHPELVSGSEYEVLNQVQHDELLQSESLPDVGKLAKLLTW